MLDWFTQFLLLCPLRGLFHGIPSSYWSNGDVTLLPGQGSASSGWATQSGLFPPQTPFCACAMRSGQITLSFISLPVFEVVNNSSSPSSCIPNTLYTTVHASYVSEWGAPCILLRSLLSLVSLDAHAFIVLIFFVLFQMAGWTVWKYPCGHTKSTFHTILGSAEHGWPPLGGHMLCQDSNDLAYVDCIHDGSREMDSEWELQSGAHGWRWLQPFHRHFDHFKS